jgi:hypothetical protein
MMQVLFASLIVKYLKPVNKPNGAKTRSGLERERPACGERRFDAKMRSFEIQVEIHPNAFSRCHSAHCKRDARAPVIRFITRFK